MATLSDPIDVQPTAPNPYFEPGEEWKATLRHRIEDTLKPAVEKLKRDLNERLRSLSPPEDSKAQTDYDNAMCELRRLANDQYRQFLERERQERRWAAGKKADEKWAEILRKEQEALLHLYSTMKKDNQPELTTRDEDRGQLPTVPDRGSLSPKPADKGRVRGSPTIPTEPVYRYSPPVHLIPDRAPLYSSWAQQSISRASGSASFESPPRPPPEIWKPPSNENPSSPTPTPGADKNRGNEKIWSSTFQSRRGARKGSPGTNDPITVASTLPDPRRGDPATATSPLTPDSPSGHTPHPPRYISSGQMANTRRPSTDESRQYLRWYPPPGTSGFRPIRAKVSDPRVRDEGFSSRSLNPSSDFENLGPSIRETVSIFPSPKFRVGKVAPPKFYPGEEESISDADDYDSEEGRGQKLGVKYTLPENNTKQMEEGVKRLEEEPRRKGAELKVKEIETKQREEEPKRREEELKREEDLSLLSDFDAPAWKRLISDTLLPHEITSLMKTIFMSKEEVRVIRDLRGDDAQAFIDIIHETLHLLNLPPRLRGKCLSVLCRMCGNQALLPKSLQIPLCYNRSDTPLYRGGFADVWKGEHNGHGVAVKVLRIYSTSDLGKTISMFCKEVVTWDTLRHPNVVSLLGVSMDKDRFAMVSEWMMNGNINQFVRTHREVNRFELLKDVAVGLIYIHGQDMMHGDLKGANILIDQNGHARLADFGLVTIVSNSSDFTFSSSTSKGGTTRWMSPELLSPDRFNLDNSRPTIESDCYALGMVIYEVLSGRAPFSPLKDVNVMLKVIEGERPGRPGGVEGTWFSDDLWKMLGLCWSTQPKDRPSVDTVLDSLKQVSGTWNPPPQQVSEGAKDEDDWDLTVLSVRD